MKFKKSLRFLSIILIDSVFGHYIQTGVAPGVWECEDRGVEQGGSVFMS